MLYNIRSVFCFLETVQCSVDDSLMYVVMADGVHIVQCRWIYKLNVVRKLTKLSTKFARRLQIINISLQVSQRNIGLSICINFLV